MDNEAEATQLVKEARDLCCTGMLSLHKFLTNSKEVLAMIPKKECIEGATDLDLALWRTQDRKGSWIPVVP